MDTRNDPQPETMAITAPGAAQLRHLEEAERLQPPAGEWQAMLLRYLPDPHGTQHSVKRFAAR